MVHKLVSIYTKL